MQLIIIPLIIILNQLPIILINLGLILRPVHLVKAGGTADLLLAVVRVKVADLHREQVRMVLLLDLGGRAGVLARRVVLHRLLAAVEHVVLVGVGAGAATLGIPLLRG